MQIATAKRLEGIGEYYFSQKLREIESLNQDGNQIINLGIGSPDLPPHPSVVQVLRDESAKPNVHAYQGYKGVPVFRQAIADWYQQWYGVTLNPDTEILPLLGSKEGIMHICMTYLNEGDRALIPNPGYPTYQSAVHLAGGIPLAYELTEANEWMPDLDALEKGGLDRIKLMWVNYPHMPTGVLPNQAMLEKVIAFGKKNGILICHDNPYSFILNPQPSSLLAIEGAMEVALELNSLSKSSNMAGWRVGMVCGAKERIAEILRFKSNMDSGMFLPVQLAAVAALKVGKEWYDELNQVYTERRTKVFELLRELGCSFSTQQAGLFVWAKIPEGYADGYALSDEVLYGSQVFITPGGIFGTAGLGYVRVSLCGSVERFEEAIGRIRKSKVKGQKSKIGGLNSK